jgi:hypothetical protein
MLQSSQLPAIRDVLIREGATRTSWRQATLDHVLPRSRGGSNHESNLITCCAECNEKRGDTCAIDWAQDVSNIRPGWIYPVSGLSVAAAAILDRLIDAMGRELPPRKARAA